MKPFSLTRAALCAAAAFAAVFATAPGTASADTSYPMVCRGGGAMSAQVQAGGDTFLYFARAPQAASAMPPGQGQCSWLDRAIHPTEPAVLRAGDLAGARYLVEGILGGGTFYVHVYNDRAGAMRITRIGP